MGHKFYDAFKHWGGTLSHGVVLGDYNPTDEFSIPCSPVFRCAEHCTNDPKGSGGRPLYTHDVAADIVKVVDIRRDKIYRSDHKLERKKQGHLHGVFAAVLTANDWYNQNGEILPRFNSKYMLSSLNKIGSYLSQTRYPYVLGYGEGSQWIKGNSPQVELLFFVLDRQEV